MSPPHATVTRRWAPRSSGPSLRAAIPDARTGTSFYNSEIKYLCAIKPDSRLSEVLWQPGVGAEPAEGKRLQVNLLLLSLSRPSPELLRCGETQDPAPLRSPADAPRSFLRAWSGKGAVQWFGIK